jgi:transcription elongation factor Elf1
MVVGKYLRASINIKGANLRCGRDGVMGRRRKKVVRIPKKRLPKFFSCPRCGKETVRVEIFREGGRAMAGCSSCGLQEEFPVKPAQSEVDVYCMLTDSVYSPSRRTSVTNTKDA